MLLGRVKNIIRSLKMYLLRSLEKQDKQHLYKIPLTGEYPCGLCHFKLRDQKIVEKHIKEYYRAAANR